ncbi:uncharacterized protein [Diadema setosum]|uniref:uncharacterized protein n=1 Tax=Diadema setosum TaxID=31175 RepID=UPI003B3BB5E5
MFNGLWVIESMLPGTQPGPNSARRAPRGSEPTSPLSSAGSSSSHRNKQLLKSYHDFTMQLFSSSQLYGEGDALFVAAVRSGDYERVENMLHRRNHEVVNIDARDKETGNTALMWAVQIGCVKLVWLLLKYGADVTLRNSNNETAVDLAGDAEMRKVLLESVMRTGVSPRHLLQAAWQGNAKVVRRLLGESKVLDINCRNADGYTPLLLVTRDVQLFESIGSALESYDPVAVVEELLRYRADPVATDKDGHSPLHLAASAANSTLADEMALRLLQIPLTADARDDRSAAPIHAASQSGSVDVVVALLGQGVDVNERGHAGATPLHVSASAGQTQVANTLLHHGADVTLVDDRGKTAVDVAKTKRMKSVLKEAWTEATHNKQEAELSPVKPPSRMGLVEEDSPRQTRLLSLSSTSPPSELGKKMLQKLTDAHKAVLAEEQMLKDIESGRFTPGLQARKLGLLRSQSRNSPAPPKTPRVLDPLSTTPSKLDTTTSATSSSSSCRKAKRSLTFSGRSSTHAKGQRSRGHDKLEKTRSDPTGHRLIGESSQIPVTVVGLDLDDSLRDVKFQRIMASRPIDRQSTGQGDFPAARHRGRLVQHRGSDSSVTSDLGASSGGGLFPQRDSNANPPLASITPLRTSHLLNLEQMHLVLNSPSPNPESASLFPNSKLVLPLTPSAAADGRPHQETIFEFEDEEENDGDAAEGDAAVDSENNLRIDLSAMNHEVQPALPHRAMFNIEASRVNALKESSDSGQGSSRSTVSHTSSSASILTSSPSPQLEVDRKEAAKNRLGIKMTPSATKLPEEKGPLFQRAQTRLPSLGRSSPMRRQTSGQGSKRKTSEDCISVLSMSSVHGHMSEMGNPSEKQEFAEAPTFITEIEAKPVQMRVTDGRTSGKRRISLENNSALVDRKRQPSVATDHRSLSRATPAVDSKVSTVSTSKSVVHSNLEMSGQVDSVTSQRLSLEEEQSAKVAPLCAASAKVAPLSCNSRSSSDHRTVHGESPASNRTLSTVGGSQAPGNCTSQNQKQLLSHGTRGPASSCVQSGSSSSLPRSSKRSPGTLEVLPVAKVSDLNSDRTGKQQSKEHTVADSKSNLKNPDKNLDKGVSRGAENKGKVDEGQAATTGLYPGVQSQGASEKVAEQKDTKCKASAGQSKVAAMIQKVPGVKTLSGISSNSDKTTSKLGQKAKSSGREKAGDKSKKETLMKPSGKSAITVKRERTPAAGKNTPKVRKNQGKSSERGKGVTGEEEKMETTWRISCNDESSSESDFESGTPRFAGTTPRKGPATKQSKEQKGNRSTVAGSRVGTLPKATKTDQTEDLLESSEAEEVLEEVIFSGEDDDNEAERLNGFKRGGPKPDHRIKKESSIAGNKEKGVTKKAGSSTATTGSKEGLVIVQQKVRKEKEVEKGKMAVRRVQPVPSATNAAVKKDTNVEQHGSTSKPKLEPPPASTKRIKDTRGSVEKLALQKVSSPRLEQKKKEEQKRGNATPRKGHAASAKGEQTVSLTSQGNLKENTLQKSGEGKGQVSIESKPNPSLPDVTSIGKTSDVPDETFESMREVGEATTTRMVNSPRSGDDAIDKKVKSEQTRREESGPSSQNHIDPAVKVTTSEFAKAETGKNMVLSPTSPKEPKPESTFTRVSKYKSPDTSPREAGKNATASPKDKRPIKNPMAAKQSPVIMDIVELFKSAGTCSSPNDLRIEVLGKIKSSAVSVKEPVRRLVKTVPKKVSGSAQSSPGKGGKGKSKERVGSGGKSRGRGGSGGRKGSDESKTGMKKSKRSAGKGKGKRKVKDTDLKLVPEVDTNTTAFISGQGWHIKTTRNEDDGDVIVRETHQEDDSSGENDELDVQLSPHHSLKLDELTVMREISVEEKKNIVNILSPLELNAPMFIPDTMGTIKEFADSLKSTSSSEMSGQARGDGGGISRKKGSKNENDETVLKDRSVNESQLEHQLGKASLQPPVTPCSGRSRAGGEKEGMTADLSDYETNPELLKVFRIKDHFETPSPRDSRKSSLNSDEEQIRERLNLILTTRQDSSSEGTEGKEEQQSAERREVGKPLRKKPPLPKQLHAHQIQPSKKHSPRQSSHKDSASQSAKQDSHVNSVVLPPPDLNNKSEGRQEDTPTKVSSEKSSILDSKTSSSSSIDKHRDQSMGDPLPNQQGEETLQPDNQRNENIEEPGVIDEGQDDAEGEDPLTKHVQTLTEQTLQELSSAIASSQEDINRSVIHTRPQSIATARSHRSLSPTPREVSDHQERDLDEAEFLDQSLALSEASSEVFRDLMETGEVSIGGSATVSSIVSSTDRSLSSNTNHSESEGTELLHWKKGNLLGKGAFGMVYLGLTNTGQLLAVKQVELSERDQEKAKHQYQKLQEEVQLLKTLAHKNIVCFLGVSLAENIVNIFMQYVPGGSIASLLARFGALEETVFCRYTKQILEGTQYLHENDVIHRDIKGANIMLMSNGIIKLIDFGCAKRLCIQLSQSQNVLRSMRGTPYWMAPEVIMETGHGKKSDIWSIGCTVFEMATRKPPWAEMPPMAAIFAIGSGDPVPQLPEKFSEEARAFVNACLSRDQSQRPAASDLLKHDFIGRRKERSRASYKTRLSSSAIEDGPIVFREQPISRDSSDARGRGRRNYAPEEFR